MAGTSARSLVVQKEWRRKRKFFRELENRKNMVIVIRSINMSMRLNVLYGKRHRCQ
jgi:hypothetical protein